MNTWQVCNQLKYLLLAESWPEGKTEPVFGQVKVSAGPTETGLAQLRFPFVILTPSDAAADAEEPKLLAQNLDARLVVRNAGDPWGEDALMGGARANGTGSSDGRGLLEIEELLFDAIGNLQVLSGVKLKVIYKSSPEPVQDSTHGYVVVRDYRFELWVTQDRSYAPASRFTAVDATGGDASLAWRVPPSRYDLRQVFVRRAAGATPPPTVTSGTAVVLPSLLPSLVTDSPGAGTFSYSVFVGYDDLNQGASDRFSAPVSVASVVVT